MKMKGSWPIALIALLCFAGWTSFGQKQQQPKLAWEYMSMTVPDYAGFSGVNKAGEQGWELVAVTQLEGANITKSYYFKRLKTK